MTINDDNSLAHYGVKGMKWGKRKGVSVRSQDSANAQKLKARVKKNGLSSLSNKEIKALTERIKLEKAYRDIKAEGYNAGGRTADKVLKKVGGVLIGAATTVAAQQVASVIKRAATKGT